MRFIVVFALALAVSMGAAQAQSWSVATDAVGRTQAVACPVDDEETGNYLCLALGCAKGAALEWRVAMAGGDLPDPLRVDFFVDEVPSGFLSLAAVPSDVPFDYRVQFDPNLHRGLLSALKEGNRAMMRLHGQAEENEVALSLKGSGKSMTAAEEICPKRPPMVDDPVAVVHADLVRQCAEFGGELEMLAGFETWGDLDGDGEQDVILDYGAAPCSTFLSLHCGSGGCATDVYLSREGGYLRAWSDVVRGVYDEPGTPNVSISVHGSACDAAGAISCVLRVDMSGDRPVIIERLQSFAANDWLEELRIRAKAE